MALNSIVRRTLWVAVLGCIGTVTVLSFVPICEKELAMAYPAALKADLSACAAGNEQLPKTAIADVGKFSRRLTGSWELTSRTIHGITTDFRTGYTSLYFDVASPGSNGQSGAALLVDRVPEFTQHGGAVSAFWKVGVSNVSNGLVSLQMQRMPGSAPAYEIAPGNFFEFHNVFVRVAHAAGSGAAETSERLVLMENVLTRVSCSSGVVERYAKVSNEKPYVNGKSLADSWQLLKDRQSAALVSGMNGGE